MTELLLWAFMGLSNTTAFSTRPENIPTPTPSDIMQLTKLPRKDTSKIAPVLVDGEGMALLVLHKGTGKELLSQNPDRPQPIASITKLMTAYIIKRDFPLDRPVLVSGEAARTGGASAELFENEELTTETLLEALLIPSANDAAVALAIAHSGSVAAFVTEMNRTATEDLQLTSATFINPTGLDEMQVTTEPDTGLEQVTPNGNTMSPRDIARLFQLTLADPVLKRIMGQDMFYGTSIDERFSHEKPTTNQLLGSFLNISEGKTGYTELAGQCLVVVGNRDGEQVISVLLGSSNRFSETKKILSWIYSSYRF